MRKGRLVSKLIALGLVLVLIVTILATACTTPAASPAPAPAAKAPAPSAAAAPPPAPASSGQTYQLKFAGWGPPPDTMEQTAEMWGNEVMKRSNGRIKITYYHGEQLGKQQDQPDMLTGGICDISTLPDLPRFPLMEIADLPFVATNRTLAMDAYYEAYYQGLFDKEIAPFKPLVFMTTDPAFMILRKAQLTNIDQLKGLKIRGRPGAITATAQAFGATGVGMNATEVYMALSTGIIDGMISTPEWVLNNKIYEVSKYAVWEPLMTGVMPLAMSLKVFNSLPADLQMLMLQVADETRSKFITRFVKTNDEMIANLKKAGFEVGVLSEDQKKACRTVTQKIVDDWVKEQTGKGNPADKVLAIFQRYQDLAK